MQYIYNHFDKLSFIMLLYIGPDDTRADTIRSDAWVWFPEEKNEIIPPKSCSTTYFNLEINKKQKKRIKPNIVA